MCFFRSVVGADYSQVPGMYCCDMICPPRDKQRFHCVVWACSGGVLLSSQRWGGCRGFRAVQKTVRRVPLGKRAGRHVHGGPAAWRGLRPGERERRVCVHMYVYVLPGVYFVWYVLVPDTVSEVPINRISISNVYVFLSVGYHVDYRNRIDLIPRLFCIVLMVHRWAARAWWARCLARATTRKARTAGVCVHMPYVSPGVHYVWYVSVLDIVSEVSINQYISIERVCFFSAEYRVDFISESHRSDSSLVGIVLIVLSYRPRMSFDICNCCFCMCW